MPYVRYNPTMNAICLVIDRLHAGYLGSYGNAWIETPAMDRLASRSLVFDHALVDTPHLDPLYRSYWQGWHAMCPPPESREALVPLLRQAGIATTLLTDEPQVARHPLSVDFDELVEIDPPWQQQNASEVDETHFARCFVQMINWFEAAQGPYLLWCHLGGLGARGMRRYGFVRRIARKATRRHRRRPKCRIDCCRPITIPTSCSACRRRMPDR